ncbi:MAG: ACT domain-containing protein [Pseudomonadota bacterium]
MTGNLIKQVTVQVENKPGKLSTISELLGEEHVNIRGIALSETADFSVVRFIADFPEKAYNVLSSHNFMARITQVIAVEVPDHPGGLNAILKPFRENNINVHYLYAHLGKKHNNPIIIFRVDDEEKALEVLKKNWVTVLGEEVYRL